MTFAETTLCSQIGLYIDNTNYFFAENVKRSAAAEVYINDFDYTKFNFPLPCLSFHSSLEVISLFIFNDM